MSLFIVFEGLDGCGAGTQSEILKEKLMGDEHVLFLRYPEYSHPLGEIIYKSLKEKLPLSQETLFMLFALDQAKDRERIRDALHQEKVVIADRYFNSNLAFQTAKDFDLEKALQIGETLELPKPDIVILLKISPQTSLARKQKEKRNLDFNEQSLELQTKVFNAYDKLVTGKIFAKEWVVVDGERNIEDVANAVEKIVKDRLNS